LDCYKEEKKMNIESHSDEEIFAEAKKREDKIAPPPPTEWDAKCSVCGNGCKVPFKPRGDGGNIKCRPCYMKGKEC